MTQETPPEKSSFGERMAIALAAFGRAVIRLILLLLIIAVLAVIGFYGFPRLYDLFIQPVEQNTTRLDDISAQIEQDQIQVTRQLATLQGQVFVLGTQAANATATLSSLEQSQAAAQTTAQAGMDEQVGVVSTALARMDVFEGEMLGIQATLDGLHQQALQNQAAQQTASSAATLESIPVQKLEQDLSLVKAMELLTRSRFLLAQNNLGLAEQDIRAARELLVSLESEVYPYQVQALENIIARLDMSLIDIQQAPALVADDLEIAWQLLYAGLPGEHGLTPAPGSQLKLATSQPTLVGTGTPTPAPNSETAATPTHGPASDEKVTPTPGTPYP